MVMSSSDFIHHHHFVYSNIVISSRYIKNKLKFDLHCWRKNISANYVLHKLSIMAVILVVSCTSMYLLCFALISSARRPSLQVSDSGTDLLGNSFLILQELYFSALSRLVSFLRYLIFLQVLDLGSSSNIPTSILISLLGEH